MGNIDISTLREKVDQVDRKLLSTMGKRVMLIKKIAELKRHHTLPPLDPSRWQHVLDTRTQWGSELGLDPQFIQDIFNRIHDYSLQIEGEICQK